MVPVVAVQSRALLALLLALGLVAASLAFVPVSPSVIISSSSSSSSSSTSSSYGSYYGGATHTHSNTPQLQGRSNGDSRCCACDTIRNNLKMMMMHNGGGGSGGGFGAATKKKLKYTGSMEPGILSPTRKVPPEIMKPDYAITGKPVKKGPALPWIIEVKTAEEIEGMRKAGRAAREILDAAGRMVKPGITTDDIDAVVHEESVKRGGYPSPLNYHGFPKSCCTSVNEIICHGIPDSSVLKEGDMVNIDVTVYLNGFHGDCSEMFMVGEVDDKGKELLQVTYDCWQAAIAFCKPGKKYQDIGGVIEDYVTAKGFSTVRNFCGHGIGRIFHTNPNILHYRNSEANGIMKAGHTFTIEPMICEGTARPVMWPDNWTAATMDGGRSAQFEHTFLMTEDGLEALTGKIDTSPRQFWETK